MRVFFDCEAFVTAAITVNSGEDDILDDKMPCVF